MNNNLGNLFQTIQKFQQFASTFRGDPQKIANQLMNSGRFSSEQIENAKKMASQMESLMNGFKGI